MAKGDSLPRQQNQSFPSNENQSPIGPSPQMNFPPQMGFQPPIGTFDLGKMTGGNTGVTGGMFGSGGPQLYPGSFQPKQPGQFGTNPVSMENQSPVSPSQPTELLRRAMMGRGVINRTY